MKIVLRGQVILPNEVLTNGAVEIDGERISDVFRQGDRTWDGQNNIIDFGKNFISPGFIDLHVHGALGRNVMDADMESFNIIGSHLIRSGVTSFLPTTVSSSLDAVVDVVECMKKAPEFPLVSKPLGVYIEGPFINPLLKGAQDAQFIKKMTERNVKDLIESVKGIKTIMTVAPESGQNLKFIPRLHEMGIVMAIGHSEATYEQALAGIAGGIAHATHLFNAMKRYHHREPGLVGAILESDKVVVEIIADGVHVHPASLNLVLESKGYEKICLVSDSVDPAGLGDGEYTLWNNPVEVKDGRVFLRGTKTLAGSVLRMNVAVKNILEWTGLSISQAVQMASLVPARVLGLGEDMGSIAKGKYANLTVFDREFLVMQSYVCGKPML
ncbi:N-acetylglucosamine-6-phosphate deacetylase [Acidobacteriota bacterium]